MINILFIVNIAVVLLLIGIILMQKSEGGVLGMGGGGRGALFSASGAGNFITKLTYSLGAAFFIICMILAYLVARENGRSKSFVESMASRDKAAEVIDKGIEKQVESKPAVPVN